MPESVKKKQEKDQKLINSHSKPNVLVKNEYKSQVIIICTVILIVIYYFKCII